MSDMLDLKLVFPAIRGNQACGKMPVSSSEMAIDAAAFLARRT
jgi:hypothetical protein